MRGFIVVVLALGGHLLAADTKNLLPNGDFEQPTGQRPDWEPLTIGASAEFQVDRTAAHSGHASGRITADNTTRVYFRSAPIPVAPGEKIHAAAWVKFKDVPVDKGTIIMIGEFCKNEIYRGDVQKFSLVDRKKKPDGDWRFIEGTLTVPALTTFM